MEPSPCSRHWVAPFVSQMQFLTSRALRWCGRFFEWSSARASSGDALLPASPAVHLQTQTCTRNLRKRTGINLYISRHQYSFSWSCNRSPFSLGYWVVHRLFLRVSAYAFHIFTFFSVCGLFPGFFPALDSNFCTFGIQSGNHEKHGSKVKEDETTNWWNYGRASNSKITEVSYRPENICEN